MHTTQLTIRTIDNNNKALIEADNLFLNNKYDSIYNTPVIAPMNIPIHNIFIHLMSPLLALVVQIKQQGNHAIEIDARFFKEKLIQEINALTEQAKTYDVPAMHLTIARYFMCTVLDELILETTWGKQAHWSNQSLLSFFHADTQGGEKFFSILQRLMNEATENSELLMFAYSCLKAGFQGKYKLIARGQDQLMIIMDELYRCICRNQRSLTASFATLDSDIKTKKSAFKSSSKKFPFKLFLMGTMTLMTICFISLKVILYHQNAINFEKLTQIERLIQS